MIVFLVFGILFMVVAIVLLFICANRGEKGIKPIIALILYTAGELNILGYSNADPRPSAMDVYKGKTELRITYEGKTPVDSVVIYKKGGEK